MCYKLALCFQKRITNATFCQSRCYKKGSFSHLFKKKNVLTAVVSVLYFLAIGTLQNGTNQDQLRGALTYRN